MSKLYHHLAIDSDVKGAYEKIRNETLKHFKDRGILEGLIKDYRPKEEGGDPLERQEKEVVTTVSERLNWTRAKAEAIIDFEIVRDLANLEAKADLIVSGETIAKGLPATFLMVLKKRLEDIRSYYNAIPTLDLSRKWEDSGKEGVYKHGPVKSYRTAKKTVPVTMAEATKEHKAQIKDVVDDVHIGTFDTTYFSGAVHPRDKANWLGKIDELLQAVKVARQRANEIEVGDRKIGGKLFDLIHATS